MNILDYYHHYIFKIINRSYAYNAPAEFTAMPSCKLHSILLTSSAVIKDLRLKDKDLHHVGRLPPQSLRRRLSTEKVQVSGVTPMDKAGQMPGASGV